ncbi:transglycosylase SLT domain-containing protein [Cystobacter fuscus]|uniref:transglycosylase SLT domain-containing protein n=1 Tax=Cystobacter fuscus TaxID=43 RepID=UPI000971557E|nr:transglycosylase SLT domain-containing protein [Cystobacter fuscus]
MAEPHTKSKVVAESASTTTPTSNTERKVVPIKKYDCDRLSLDEIKKIVKEHNKSKQPDEFIICQIYKESDFYPCAKSSESTASGFMGLTVTAVMDVIGQNKGETKEQWRARARTLHSGLTKEQNIEYATKYLQMRIDRAGDLEKGVNGYGTGAGYSTNINACAECMRRSGVGVACLEKIRKW